MPKAAIFDLDGTLLDSVDLHALAWHEAMKKFGHDVLRTGERSDREGRRQAHSRIPFG
jgi:beta-phosphoglucomutase-like phosphatase (HAD superfamily)